ncbi:MAG: hypothetical protein Q8P59_09945 [Dehalococcoidia bacterium]|nr:hypothetical protein [Dehalococcoidia bacterium]
MPKARCTPCISPKARELLEKAFPAARLNLANVPTCAGEALLELCARPKRAQTPRNAFMSTCLKGAGIKGFRDAPRAMKACSTQWREQKERGRV